ncbi:MAG: hydantoinase B/oxoprolinase family protein, partial [SAR324 cluster bacterium]|nr:hydantoinase B/oxoprolinase family protein [SAR324 cluster bacterium]
ISDWSAQNVYKAQYNTETLKLDQEGTETARQEERQNRIQQAKTYDEFEQDWLEQQMDESLLKFYGTWPNAEVVAPPFRP